MPAQNIVMQAQLAQSTSMFIGLFVFSEHRMPWSQLLLTKCTMSDHSFYGHLVSL